MPDEEREFSLDGIKRKAKKAREWIRQCQACGFCVAGKKSGTACKRCGRPWPQQPKSAVTGHGVARVRAGEAPSLERLRAEYLQLCVEGRERNYSPKWAGVEFKKRHGFWPTFSERRAS